MGANKDSLSIKNIIDLFTNYLGKINVILVSILLVNINVSQAQIQFETKDSVLFYPPDIQQICLSPDGKKIAYFPGRWVDNLNIITKEITTDKKTKISLSQNDIKKKYIGFLSWVSNNRLVFSVGTTQEGSGPVYAIDYDGSNFIELFPSKNSYSELIITYVFDVLANDDDYILVKAYESGTYDMPTLTNYNNIHTTTIKTHTYFIWNYYRVNINTGDKELIYKGTDGYSSISFNKNGEPAIALDYDNLNGKLEFYIKRKNETTWSPIVINHSDSLSTIMEMGGKELTNKHCVLLGMGYGDSTFYYGSNITSDKMNIYEYHITTGNTSIVAETKGEYDLVDPLIEFGESNLIFSNTSQKLIGFNFMDVNEKTIWIDEKFNQIQMFLDNHFNGNINKILEWDKNEEIFLLFTYRSDMPGEYYILNLKTKLLALCGYYNYKLKDEKLFKTIPIDFLSRDGSTIHGYLTLPCIQDSNTLYPLLVNIHGGPWSRDYYRFDPSIQFYSSKGFAYLQINFRGSTGIGYKHFIEGKKNYGMTAIHDIMDGIHALINEGLIDQSKIAIMGTSYGGYATLISLIKYDSLFKCGISIAGPTDLTKQINSYLPEYGRSLSYEFWETMFGDVSELKIVSPINYCERIKKAIMIIHGDKDKIVDVEQSRSLVSELEIIGIKPEYLELEDEGHGGWNYETEILINKKILEFLNKNLY